MKWTSTLQGKFKWFVLISIIAITAINSKSYAQSRIYANQVTIGNAAADHVDNAGNAVLPDNSFATVKSSGALLGGYKGQLEIKFPTTLAAGTTSFVRIDFNPDILNALLGGNLGGALADLVGGLVLGNHSFVVEARNGSTTVLSGSSTGAFTNANLRLVTDAS